MTAVPDASTTPGLAYLLKWAVDALELLHESASLDFKQSEEWDVLRPKFVKHAMAMGNQEGGGLVIVGVAETGSGIKLEGMKDEHLATYSRDKILDWVNQYASPALDLIVATIPYQSKVFLAIEVKEFQDTPFVCKKRGDKNLEVGEVYVRLTRGKPESTKIQSADHLQALLNRAAEKRAQRIIQGAHRVGFIAGRAPMQDYLDEAREFWDSNAVKRRMSGPHWALTIRGERFEKFRLDPLLKARQVLDQAVVHHGRSRFPWGREQTQGNDWVSGVSRLQEYRLYQSGQFALIAQVSETMTPEHQEALRKEAARDSSPSQIDWAKVPGFLVLDQLLGHLGDFVEFASRLCRTPELVGPTVIDVALCRVQGHCLTVDNLFDVNWNADEHFVSSDRVGRSWTFGEDRLMGGTSDVALDVCRWFLERFDVRLDDRVLVERVRVARERY